MAGTASAEKASGGLSPGVAFAHPMRALGVVVERFGD
jgi:hypothetical protein